MRLYAASGVKMACICNSQFRHVAVFACKNISSVSGGWKGHDNQSRSRAPLPGIDSSLQRNHFLSSEEIVSGSLPIIGAKKK